MRKLYLTICLIFLSLISLPLPVEAQVECLPTSTEINLLKNQTIVQGVLLDHRSIGDKDLNFGYTYDIQVEKIIHRGTLDMPPSVGNMISLRSFQNFYDILGLSEGNTYNFGVNGTGIISNCYQILDMSQIQLLEKPMPQLDNTVFLITLILIIVFSYAVVTYMIRTLMSKSNPIRRKYYGLIFMIGLLIFNYVIVTDSFYWIATFAVLIIYLLLLIYFRIRYTRIKSVKFSNLVVPTFRTDLKFYELGLIDDGRLSEDDILAILCKIILNNEKPDEIEAKIIKHFKIGDLNNLKNVVFMDGRGNPYIFILRDIISPIYKNLMQKGLLYFNYHKWNLILGFICMIYSWIVVMSVVLFYNTAPTIIQFMYAIGLVILVAFLTLYEFSQNFEAIQPIRAKLHGYKMYLKTAEIHRVTADEKLFRELIPYFVSFRIKKEHTKMMRKYVLDQIKD